MPQAISVSTVLSMNVPAVTNGPPVTHNTAVSGTIASTVDVSPTWPATVRIAAAPSVMPPITFSSTVLLQRTQARVSFLMRETQRGFDVVPVVQVFEGGIVTVRGRGLIVAHAPPAMVLFFLFLFLPLTFAFVLTAVAVLCKPGCAIRAADTSSV